TGRDFVITSSSGLLTWPPNSLDINPLITTGVGYKVNQGMQIIWGKGWRILWLLR
ncbi:Hypothetical protein FKW44_011337, partial [Caligus rogercresseyi]